MKNKYLILSTICALLCVLGCSCDKQEQPQGGSTPPDTTSTDSSTPDEIVIPEEPILSVNQSSVTLGVGESYTLTAEAENVDAPVFVWAVDGDYPEDVVSIAQEGNTAAITAKKAGETKLIASIACDGIVYFRTVSVVVKEDSGVTLVLSDNVGFDDNGYHIDLATLATDNGDITSIVPLVTAYKNNKIVGVDSFTWSSQNLDIVKTEGNKFLSVAEGKTSIIGSAVIGGEEYLVEISVNVYRPTIALEESFTVEVENLSSLELVTPIKGIAKTVSYNGEAVGSFDSQTKKITLEKKKLPTMAALMGENRQLILDTSLASYTINVDLYTKIIRTKDEFDGMADLSKSCGATDALWDGYFVLDGDISYNGLFKSKIADIDSLWITVGDSWFNGGLYGFRGVFDGKGHVIDGISIDNGRNLGGVFGVLHIDGVIKNVSFTNASVAANSSLVCGAGGGSVENVYVQYASIGKGAQYYEADGSINCHTATFFGFKEPTSTANVSNCVIDVTKASFNENTSIKLVGSEHAAIKNVFLIGGTKALQKASNATLSFDAMIDFVESTNAQGRYKGFDSNFWSHEDGVPVPDTLYNTVVGGNVEFDEMVALLAAGTSYKFVIANSYVKITSNNEKVTVQSGIATVSPSVENGEQVTFTATSIFNSSKKATFTCTLAKLSNVTEIEGDVFYDITLNKVYFADGQLTAEDVFYFVDEAYGVASFAKDGEPAKTMLAVTESGFYKFACQTVTKVIASADDLHYIRRDYTVEDYGNKGKYDGKLLGTFVLLNDIDCTGLTLKDTGNRWENRCGFAGTFDGRGYTISNLTVGKNGLFGALTYATIRDVNFTGVRLTSENGDGQYVALFASRIFNTVIENVAMEFVTYVAGENVYSTSGLLCYEATFDCTFRNLTIDISKISGVKYLTESVYATDVPYLSQGKSTYENITVIVADLNDVPAFAFKSANGDITDRVDYPDGVTVKDVNGSVMQ